MPTHESSPRRVSGLIVSDGSRRGSKPTNNRPAWISQKKPRYKNNPGGKIAYLYCITDGEHYKIGWATNPSKRLLQLQTGNPRQLTIHAQLRCSCTAQAMMRERNLHKQYRRFRLVGEWFTDVVARQPFGKYKEKI